MGERWDPSIVGKQMKGAAVQAGLTVSEVARRLGVSRPVIHRWWSGEQCPGCGTLLAYARVVGKPVSYFLKPAEGEEPGEGGEQEQELLDLLLPWAQLLMAGSPPDAAFDRVAGELQELTPPERRRLAAAAAEMRADLRAAAGGDWARLTEQDQRQILHQIARMAA
jgi:transcriptional regulator with XRE-family HTH domain